MMTERANKVTLNQLIYHRSRHGSYLQKLGQYPVELFLQLFAVLAILWELQHLTVLMT